MYRLRYSSPLDYWKYIIQFNSQEGGTGTKNSGSYLNYPVKYKGTLNIGLRNIQYPGDWIVRIIYQRSAEKIYGTTSISSMINSGPMKIHYYM